MKQVYTLARVHYYRAKNHFSRLTPQYIQGLLLGLLSVFGVCSFSQAATVSDLLISEIMADPTAVTDSNGEWFELFNPGNEAVNLDGITLHDDGSNSVLLSGSGLSIASGSYFVLARNGDSLSNGGFSADYVYGGGFSWAIAATRLYFPMLQGNCCASTTAAALSAAELAWN